jgi:hypothetical protein
MGANVHHGLGGGFGVLRRLYGVSSWSRKTKKSHFTTTTTPCEYLTYLEDHVTILINNGTKRKALSLTVMITMTMTMNDDDDAGNDDGGGGDDGGGDDSDNGDDGDDNDDNGNDDGGGGDKGNNQPRRWQ